MRTPPNEAWPAITLNTLAPRAAMRSLTAFCAPLPSATIVITAPTPMMMPSIVEDRAHRVGPDGLECDRDRLTEQHA